VATRRDSHGLAGAQASPEAQRARRASGHLAEQLFDLSMTTYARRGLLYLCAMHFPVRGAPGHMVPAGKGDYDRGGWFRTGAGDTVALAVDVKVLNETKASYVHDVQERHQLERLHDFAAGGLALLALYCPGDDCWLLTTHLTPMLAGESLPLREKIDGRWSYGPGVRGAALAQLVPASTPREIASGAPPYAFLPALQALQALQRIPDTAAPTLTLA
jgi:hypothetical protein